MVVLKMWCLFLMIALLRGNGIGVAVTYELNKNDYSIEETEDFVATRPYKVNSDNESKYVHETMESYNNTNLEKQKNEDDSNESIYETTKYVSEGFVTTESVLSDSSEKFEKILNKTISHDKNSKEPFLSYFHKTSLSTPDVQFSTYPHENLSAEDNSEKDKILNGSSNFDSESTTNNLITFPLGENDDIATTEIYSSFLTDYSIEMESSSVVSPHLQTFTQNSNFNIDNIDTNDSLAASHATTQYIIDKTDVSSNFSTVSDTITNVHGGSRIKSTSNDYLTFTTEVSIVDDTKSDANADNIQLMMDSVTKFSTSSENTFNFNKTFKDNFKYTETFRDLKLTETNEDPVSQDSEEVSIPFLFTTETFDAYNNNFKYSETYRDLKLTESSDDSVSQNSEEFSIPFSLTTETFDDETTDTTENIFNDYSSTTDKIFPSFRGILDSLLHEQQPKKQNEISTTDIKSKKGESRFAHIQHHDYLNNSSDAQQQKQDEVKSVFYFYGAIINDADMPCITLKSTLRIFVNGSEVRLLEYNTIADYQDNTGNIIFYGMDESKKLNVSIRFNISCSIHYCSINAISVTLYNAEKKELTSKQHKINLFKADYGFVSENQSKLTYVLDNGVVLEIDHATLYVAKNCKVAKSFSESGRITHYKEIIGGVFAVLVLVAIGAYLAVRSRRKQKLIIES